MMDGLVVSSDIMQQIEDDAGTTAGGEETMWHWGVPVVVCKYLPPNTIIPLRLPIMRTKPRSPWMETITGSEQGSDNDG